MKYSKSVHHTRRPVLRSVTHNFKNNWYFETKLNIYTLCVHVYIYYSLFYDNINIKYILKMSTGNCYEYDEVRSLESCVVGVSLAICCWFRAKVKWIFCWVSSARNARSSVSAWLRSWKSFQKKKRWHQINFP